MNMLVKYNFSRFHIMFSLKLNIILFNLLLLIYLLANFPHVFRFSSTFLRAHIAPWPTLHYWTTNKPICPKQFQTKAAASPPTLYTVSLSEPCRNHNKQTDSEREREKEGGRETGRWTVRQSRDYSFVVLGLARCLAFG